MLDSDRGGHRPNFCRDCAIWRGDGQRTDCAIRVNRFLLPPPWLRYLYFLLFKFQSRENGSKKVAKEAKEKERGKPVIVQHPFSFLIRVNPVPSAVNSSARCLRVDLGTLSTFDPIPIHE